MKLAGGVQPVLEAIRETYTQDRRPWVIGFSGGKDSTCTLQLVWQALKSLPKPKRGKPIHVISSNTLVETPAIVSYIRSTIAAIENAGRRDGLNIAACIVEPRITESFWVNVIGRGYPAPTTKFRWCTERLKIHPADRFIKDQVAAYGEVVLALGVRSSESATRAQVMALRKIEGQRLRTHKTLAGALVFAPIRNGRRMMFGLTCCRTLKRRGVLTTTISPQCIVPLMRSAPLSSTRPRHLVGTVGSGVGFAPS